MVIEMSVSDPLLRELKACTVKLMQVCTSSYEVCDDSLNLLSFCQNVEQVFQKGVVHNYSVLGFATSAQSWHWLEQVAKLENSAGLSYQAALLAVKTCPKVSTPVGRLRLLIRTCLVKKCLHVPVEILVRGRYPRNVYDPVASILGDEILGEIFLSVLLQCSRLTFQLDLCNCSFLDSSWLLPCICKMEFVPCKSLGICVTFVSGKAVVAAVKINSVAAEDDKVEVGDVLDELNGRHVTTSMRGQLASIMRKCFGKPVLLTLIKACYPGTSSLYPPLVSLLKQAHLDPSQVQSRHCKALKEHQENTPHPPAVIRAGQEVTYVGYESTGSHGDVRCIEQAVTKVLVAECNQLNLKVAFECQEMGVRVADCSTGKVYFKHSYMEISSCGRTLTWPHHFAYIAGEQNCNIAQSFTCFVFFCGNGEHIQNILQSIGQGFQRTHFAV